MALCRADPIDIYVIRPQRVKGLIAKDIPSYIFLYETHDNIGLHVVHIHICVLKEL